MRLVRKFTLALVLGILAVMAFGAYLQVRRDIALFEADMVNDEHAMGHALRNAVKAVWSSAGEERAQALIAQTNVSQAEVNIRWVWLDEPEGPAGTAELRPEQVAAVQRGHDLTLVRRGVDRSERRYTYVPVPTPQGRMGALELSESLGPQRRFIRTTELQVLVASIAVAAGCAVVAILLGVWFVGRPMRHLAEKARRVGTGDLSGPLLLRQRDEIGELAAELNAMCDRLAEANRRVAAEIEARIATLEQLRHADRLKTVGQLASGVAHELGTPLNVVAGRAKMIATGGMPGGDVGNNARIIVEQADRMTAIIRQLLDFSRRRGPHLVHGDLAQVVARTLEILSALAAQRGVTLRLEAAAEPFVVQVDPNQIQQALTNIVLNGIQAMTRGGRLAVTVERCAARPPAGHHGSDGEWVCVAVADEGAGIPRDQLPRIFEPFFTTKGVGEGTGLGLSVAYGIVHEHGGWIAVESEPGRGSRFVVFLPSAVAAQREGAA